MSEENKPIRTQKSEMQFGNTTYIITTTFNENARETVEQKYFQLIADRISSEMKQPRSQQNGSKVPLSMT